ncbi:Isotrichodermin C-15 hydroxylase [Cercophora samala]|uniref:Isotrichodermin C-15 hydroxylase n=1 Tax=Cercophora samala TaxID=330535 RepID=A0AA39Z0U0_9PEZI|nr:Isotrichodermin C-15 hydroxylase [Cercophora samala]
MASSAIWNTSNSGGPAPVRIEVDEPIILGKWVYYLGVPFITTVLWFVWDYILKTLLLRRWYEKQGINFVDNCYAVVGAEMQVTKLQEENKSHDWLYTDKPTNLYGTLRGLSLQLYTTNAKLCSELVGKTGKQVDRNTPALHSVGRLSPSAIPFQSMHKLRFKDRKANLTKSTRDNKRLFEIVERQANHALDKFSVKNEDGRIEIDARDLLEYWTRCTSGEFVWGQQNIEGRTLTVEQVDGVVRTLPFMDVLNQTFTELRFYSSRFWNRVCFPLASLPLTKEARRLSRNINILRDICTEMMNNPLEGTVASLLQEMNDSQGMPDVYSLDDLITATFAGLDAVKSAVMGCIYHMLNPEHAYWRQAMLEEMNKLSDLSGDMDVNVMQAPILTAFMWESLRFEPPGSLINNAAVKDFELNYQGQTYKIKAGTRIVSSIHALHQHEESWRQIAPDMSPLTEFDPNRFLKYGDKLLGSSCFMPFGKGPRRCPGQAAGALMVKTFLKVFIQRDLKNCTTVRPDGQSKDASRFHVYSKATYNLVFDE